MTVAEPLLYCSRTCTGLLLDTFTFFLTEIASKKKKKDTNKSILNLTPRLMLKYGVSDEEKNRRKSLHLFKN